MPKILFPLLAMFVVSGCAPFQPHTDLTPPKYYVVKQGDNIHSIAFALEVTPGRLRAANPWVDLLYPEPGTRLVIPADSTSTRATAGNAAGSMNPVQAQIADRLRGIDFIWPLARFEVTSPFGRRRGRAHAGIDLGAARGTAVRAAAAGRVVLSEYNRGYGYMIVIDHGGGIETAYAHNSRNLVQRGARVQQGEIIASVGRSGNATGYHLHFELRSDGRALNPARHLQAAR